MAQTCFDGLGNNITKCTQIMENIVDSGFCLVYDYMYLEKLSEKLADKIILIATVFQVRSNLLLLAKTFIWTPNCSSNKRQVKEGCGFKPSPRNVKENQWQLQEQESEFV